MMFMTILFPLVLNEAGMIREPSAFQPISALSADPGRSNATACVGGSFSFSSPESMRNFPVASLCCPETMYRASMIPRKDSPLLVISIVTCLNFSAAYMVITFHVPTLSVALVERMAGCQLGGFQITPTFTTSFHKTSTSAVRPQSRPIFCQGWNVLGIRC